MGTGKKKQRSMRMGTVWDVGQGRGDFIRWASEKEGEWGPKTNYFFLNIVYI